MQNNIFILLFTAFFLFACNQEKSNVTAEKTPLKNSSLQHTGFYSQMPFDLSTLQEGDILLRRGRGTVSNYIIAVLDEAIPVSHCGMVYLNDEGEWDVVHAISKDQTDISGVVTESLQTFLQESIEGTLILVRIHATDEERSKMAKKAVGYAEKKVPFDFSFDIKNPERMYCTEVIWKVSKEVLGKNLFTETINPGEIDILKFSNFFNPDFFEVIFSDHEKLIVSL